MQRNPHSYQIATGYRTFYSLSLIYQPITKKRLFIDKKFEFLIPSLPLPHATKMTPDAVLDGGMETEAYA